MIGDLGNKLFSLIGQGFSYVLNFLVWLGTELFNGLKELLVWLFTPLFQLIAAIFYFLYKLGMLLISVIDLIFKLVFFFWYIAKGLFITFIGLSYNGAAAKVPARYQEVFDHVKPAFDYLQIGNIAVLCLFAVWIFVAVSCIKIIGSRTD